MKQLLILSGKGGTGKTTLASSFIELGKFKGIADCDVDAPNLAILTDLPEKSKKSPYYGMEKAFIDRDKCKSCNICKENCNFNAIKVKNGQYYVDQFSCEGCSLCERLCPYDAIEMKDNKAGELELYEGDGEVFSTAKLKMGEGNSGLLVTEVKKALKGKYIDIAIIDGSPGIGCPVIASLNDVDLVVLVAEPSLSAFSDLKRIIATAENFDKEVCLVINKYDVNKEVSEEILTYANKKDIEVLGKIPFDRQIVKNLNKGLTAVEDEGSKAIRKIYDRAMDLLREV